MALDVTPEAMKIFHQICTDEVSKALVGVKKEIYDIQVTVLDLQVSVLDALNKVSQLKHGMPVHEPTPTVESFNPKSEQAAIDLSETQKEIVNLDWKYLQLSNTLHAEVSELRHRIDDLQLQSSKRDQGSQFQDANLKAPLSTELIACAEDTHLLNNDDRLVPEDLPPEYVQIVKHAAVEHALAPDTWDAATLALVKDLPDVMTGSGGASAMRMLTVFSCLALNLFLQIMLLYWLFRHVLLENVAIAQRIYQTFHGEAFIAGKFNQEAFDSLGDLRSRICELAISRHLFMIACLFLWVARCANEMNHIVRLKGVVDALPPLPEGVDPVYMAHEAAAKMGGYWKEHNEEQKVMIVCLNRLTRLMLNFLIFGPRSIVALGMLLMGVAFLSASQSHTDLILNSLAMAFVFDIDELIMRAFLPLNLARNLTKTTINIPSKEDIHNVGGMQLQWEKAREVYGRSLITLILAVIFIVFWFRFLPVLPGYKWDLEPACDGYLEKVRRVQCNAWEMDCFPTG